MGANKKAYALIGLSVAMIALQAVAVFGVALGARNLWNSDPAVAAVRAASVVASSVAGTLGQDEQPVRRLARSVVPVTPASPSAPSPMVFDLSSFKMATVSSSDGTECYLVGPNGKVRKLDVEKIRAVVEERLGERLEALEDAAIEIDCNPIERMSSCTTSKRTERPAI